MESLRFLLAWLIAAAIFPLRWSCRIRWHDDPRAALRASGRSYIYAILHCHQVAAVLACEPGTAAMVSRSTDGDLLVPSLRAHGMIAVRGSSRHDGADKGGAGALRRLTDHVRGGSPAYLAVDGPRGPRNHVRSGIAALSQTTGALVLIAVPVPRRRWILRRTWDRFQIPKPFTRIDVFFGEPIAPVAGEEVNAYCRRIESAINALEERYDRDEAVSARAATLERSARRAPGAAMKPPAVD